MLSHLHAQPQRPQRVVVIGAAGFVGSAVVARLKREALPVLAIGRAQVDLLAADAPERLGRLLEPGDAVVAAAARAPVKNTDMLVENIVIAHALARALSGPVSHVVNIGSDAIYADSARPLTEASTTAPDSLHGVMHLARELALLAEVKAPMALLRPTLIYGTGDPHNGYGPNRFRRLASAGAGIALFGDGEERRDHVWIDDVAELVVRVLFRRSTGKLNVATGEVHTFRQIAESIVRLSNKEVPIASLARSGPMPHNGYRAFDISACAAAFPDFRFTPLLEGLAKVQPEASAPRADAE